MKPRNVIYLTGSGVVLYARSGQHFVPVSGYELPDGDPTPLISHLRQAPAAVIALIVDVLEEEHTRDSMARLGVRDRDAILSRRLARLFPRTPYRTAAVQGRLPNDPQTIRVLLSGLTKADHLRTLLGLLAEAKLPVSLVCSPALLSRPLLDKLRPASPADATLLVSRQREGSLRLTFFRGRDLVGSRLMRRSLAAPPGDIARLVRQLEESVRYFDAAFAPSATNPVDVLLLCEPDIDPADATLRGTGHEGFRLHVPEPAAAARKLGLDAALQPGNADLLFVELLRRHAPAGNFALAADRRYFHLHQVRTFGKAACLALAAGALLNSAVNVVGIAGVTREAASARNSAEGLRRQLDEVSAGDISNGADPLEMERIAKAWQLLREHAVEPRDVLGLVSKALDSSPQVQIEGIEWLPVQARTASTEGDDAGAGDAEPTPDESSGESPEAASAGPDAGAPSPDSRVRLTIRGRVDPFEGDYPLAFMYVRTFMQSLREDPRVLSVTALKDPLDISTQSSISGEMTRDRKAEKAAFTISVLLKVTHEPA